MAVGAGNVDVDEDDDNAADMENNAGEDLDKVNAPVDMEEEDGEYVGDDEDGGQGRRQRLLLTRKDFWPMQCYFYERALLAPSESMAYTGNIRGMKEGDG